MPWLLLLACVATDPRTAPADSGSGTDTGDGAGGSTGPLEVAIGAPALDADGVAAAISAVAQGGLPDAAEVQHTYVDLLEATGADTCPASPGLSVLTAFGGCTSELNGWFWAGITEYDGGGPGPTTPYTLLGDLQMETPEGERFTAAGQISFELSGSPEASTWSLDYSGTFSWPDAEGFMALPGASAVLWADGAWSEESWELALEGSLTDGQDAIYVQDLHAGAMGCEGQPAATFGLRGEGGYWYTLAATDCGCGEVSWADGSVLGEACVDMAAPLEAMARSPGETR